MVHIAFVGKAGSGKTTLSNYLVDKYNFVKLSFAKPVKDIARNYFGLKGAKHRDLLQAIGQKMREIDENVWINILLRKVIKINFAYASSIVIDDCRYKNEAETLSKWNFILIRLIGRQLKLTKEQSRHLSEMELENIHPDYILDTSKNLEETKRELDGIIDEVSKV